MLVYDAWFVDESLYGRATLPFQEAGWATPNAQQLDLNQLPPDCPLYPAGLQALLNHPLEMTGPPPIPVSSGVKDCAGI